MTKYNPTSCIVNDNEITLTKQLLSQSYDYKFDSVRARYVLVRLEGEKYCGS